VACFRENFILPLFSCKEFALEVCPSILDTSCIKEKWSVELDIKAVNCEKPGVKQTQSSARHDSTNKYVI
jgi:hypothetical protein